MMDELFDLDLYFGPQSVQKRGSAEQSTAALIASSMNSDYTDEWSHRQEQAPNHMVQAPTMTQLGPPSYASDTAVNDSLPICSTGSNGDGSFGVPSELSLPPLSAPMDNVNFIPQFSDLINYSDLEAFTREGEQSKNGAVAYGNNGSATFGDNAVLESAVCQELQRIDGQPGNRFMGNPSPSKKNYAEEMPYYTDLDIFKPSEDGPKNSDGSFLSPSVEIDSQYSPSCQSNVQGGVSSKEKVKSPRKTPSKKRKGVNNENPSVLPRSQTDNSDSPLVNEYIGFNDLPSYGDGNFSRTDSNSVAFPQIPLKPESTTLNKGKVKSPRKTPSRKKQNPVVSCSESIDGSSLKIKLKCEKSIGTESTEWSVSGDANEKVNKSPANHAVENSSTLGIHGNLDPPTLTTKVVENKTEPVPSRDPSQSEDRTKASGDGIMSTTSPVFPMKDTRPPSTLKIKCPTAKAPSYLMGFPMRCPEYPIVYCCNYCGRIFTSLRGGQLHECVKKRPGRKAGVKSQ